LKNSGWRKNCDYIKTFDKYVHIKHEGQNKTLSISKIESIVPSSPDMHKAIKNYELFHKMEPGTAKPMNVYKSSAGVEGWANYEIKIDEDNINEIFICGGGAFNSALMTRLEALTHPIPLQNTTTAGVSPQWVEGCAFAWLAKQCIEGLPGNCPAVTGASKAVVLGTICPA
jgi:hypothetical protein